MKKKLLIAGLCLSMAMPVALAACGNSQTGQADALSSDEVYGMGAVTTVKLLGNSVSAGAVKSLSALVASDAAQTEVGVKAQAEKFNEYFSALDSFLGDDIVSTSTSANTDENYPYDTKMVISGKNFNGDTVSYVMYYTETLIKTKTDRDEVKSEFSLQGVMVIDGADYFLEGEREEEYEKDETETELKIRAYADLADRTSYVQMKQEHSMESGEEETEYVYSVYSGGRLIEQTAVEFETETKGGKVETEYELEFRSGTAKGKYKVKREVKNNVTEIKVKYDVDGEKGEFRIREITDKNGEKLYEYIFSDGSNKVLGR